MTFMQMLSIKLSFAKSFKTRLKQADLSILYSLASKSSKTISTVGKLTNE